MSLEAPRRRLPASIGVLGSLMLLCCLVVVAAAVLILRDGSDSGTNSGNRIVYGLTLIPSGFDPQIYISSELGIPFFSVYDTLVYRHPQQLNFVPGLAERWEMSSDGLSWTFYLRQGVKFHDGEPFNAQAVGVNLDRITNPDIASGKARALLGPYTGYTIVDEYTITLHLSEPYAPLLDGLSQVYLGIASPKALAEYTKNTYQWHQVGTGPYKLVEMVPREKIVLQRNEDYWGGPVFYADVTPQSIDTIEFRFYQDPPTRSLALESGEVQMIGELLPTDAELLAGNPTLRIYRVPVAGTPQQLFFNTQRAPTDDLNVRQALLYGTNRTAIIDAVFQGQSPVAYGPLVSVMKPFYDPSVESMYPYDPDYARSLLAGAGYSDTNGDGMLERDGVPLKLTLTFAPWNQMADVAQLIQSQWHDLGIDLTLDQVADFPTLSSREQAGNYNLIGFYDFGTDPSILNQFYLSDGANNWSHINDPELDNWLHEGVRQSNDEARVPLYQSAQQRIMEQAAVLPIREYVNLDGATAKLDGVVFSAQGWWPLLRNLQLNP
jgi:peptide/nickel transport system substrate-binding protein